jgi:hypothetical protein
MQTTVKKKKKTMVGLMRPAWRGLDSLAVNRKTLEHVFSSDVKAEIPSRSVTSGTCEIVCSVQLNPDSMLNTLNGINT